MKFGIIETTVINHCKDCVVKIIVYQKSVSLAIDLCEDCQQVYEDMQPIKIKQIRDATFSYKDEDDGTRMICEDCGESYKPEIDDNGFCLHCQKKRKEMEVEKCSFCSNPSVHWDGHYNYCEQCKVEAEN